MTRRKDTIRVRNQSKKTIYQKRNSRLEKQKQQEEGYQEEKRQEKHLLSKVEVVLPDELIRLIYDYLTGEAKLNFNPKYEQLRVGFYSFPLQLDLDSLFKKMSNDQILDLIYTGTLQKYPEIIGDLSYDFYYSIIDHDFRTVTGYHLLQLWSSRRLSYDFITGVHEDNSDVKTELDLNIRHKLAMAIRNYIKHTFYGFCNSKNKRTDALDDKNILQYQNYRNLFVGMEKAYYLYRVVLRFIDKPEPEPILKKVVEAPYDPFSNELLIPTPLDLTI